jgi:2-polyprenyl-3-methyl-5-hydroxy-6-metoxy-1,4-benzoquinol methylase
MLENDIRPDDLLTGQLEAYQKDLKCLQQKFAGFVRVSCPACGSQSAHIIFEKYKCTFDVCNSCEMIYMNPRPTPEIMASYYRDSENYRYWAKYIFPASEAARKEKLYKPRVQRIMSICLEREIACGRLLEIGAGFGSFAQTVSQAGIFQDIVVIEPTPEMAAACQQRGLKVIEKRAEDVVLEEIGTVDVLVAFEVVEHLFAPVEFFRQAHRLLSPGGLLVVSCPNGQGFDVMMLGELSSAVDTEHVNLFTPGSLQKMFEAEEFTDIQIDTPGRLDAELVRKAVLSGVYKLSDPFMRRVLIDEWETLSGPFQDFLIQNKLSSHMWACAQKRS